MGARQSRQGGQRQQPGRRAVTALVWLLKWLGGTPQSSQLALGPGAVIVGWRAGTAGPLRAPLAGAAGVELQAEAGAGKDGVVAGLAGAGWVGGVQVAVIPITVQSNEACMQGIDWVAGGPCAPQ